MLNRLRGVFASLEKNNVRYLVIGGIAAVLHGVPRATFDLDVLIEDSEDNAERLLTALEDAGLATATLTSADGVLRNEITVFEDRVRIDVQTQTSGIAFEDARENREVMEYKGQTFYVLSRTDLIASMKTPQRDGARQDIRLIELQAGQEGAAHS